ncbi:MAG: hypothetical protein RL226_1239, partial [Bacteroidota bacterium]
NQRLLTGFIALEAILEQFSSIFNKLREPIDHEPMLMFGAAGVMLGVCMQEEGKRRK